MVDRVSPPVSTPSRLRPLPPADMAAKRVLDLVVAGGGLFALWPLLGLIAVAIRLDSPGPVLFKQRRVGRYGTHFQMFKFRTMRVGTPDLPTHEMARLPSPVTRVGKWLRRTSLDELPQLWHVLTGEMSLVGPRPALYNQDDLNAQRAEAGVDALLPGITGWAQVNGRDELTVPDKVAADRHYLDHFSFALDLRILLKTCQSVVSGRGTR